MSKKKLRKKILDYRKNNYKLLKPKYSLLKKVLLLVADAMYDLPCLELPKIEFTICMYIKDII